MPGATEPAVPGTPSHLRLLAIRWWRDRGWLDRDPTDGWARPKIIVDTTAERRRPWTPTEIKAFTETVGRLAEQMGPEWHDELRDITSRAIPLATTTPDTAGWPPQPSASRNAPRRARHQPRWSDREPNPTRHLAQSWTGSRRRSVMGTKTDTTAAEVPGAQHLCRFCRSD